MKFIKMHGLGNDYVYVDGSKENIEDPEKLAVFVSDRHFGIGSDGLIVINPSDAADFEMAMYNADGSRGEMCGNGIRCVAKFVYDNGLTDKTEISVETLAGIKYLRLEVLDGKVQSVRVDMGEPVLEADMIPVAGFDAAEVILPEGVEVPVGKELVKKAIISRSLSVDGKNFDVTCVSMGNPHCVTFVEDVDELELEKTGSCFENHRQFPNRINTEFIQLISRKRIRMRVWERGSGETLACGTGACASVVASILNGFTDRKVCVELKGGELEIEWANDGHVYMTGPATTVFRGEIELPF